MAENTKKRQATKKRLRDAMMKLYSLYDFQKITVSMISKEAKCHRSTFYLYYNNTNELLREIENYILKEFQRFADRINNFDFSETEKTSQEIFDSMTPMMIQFYEWQMSMRSYILPLMGAYRDSFFIKRYEKAIYDNIFPAVKAFHLKYEHQAYVVKYLTGGVFKTNRDWLENQDISVEELVNIHRRMVFSNPFA